MADIPRAVVGKYPQKSVRKRLEAFFLDNVGKIATREQVQQVARDPKTKEIPENWHQRLSELRTDSGYTILTHRDRKELKISEYLMLTADRRPAASARVRPSTQTWKKVLERATHRCEWNEGGETCDNKESAIDPIGGGTVHLTPDHKTPHSVNPASDPNDANAWQALCGRHQIVKKNFWDSVSGKLNAYAIVQAASKTVKREIYAFLKDFFAEEE